MNDLNIRQFHFLKIIAGFFNISFHMKPLGLCLLFFPSMALADPLEAGLGALERGHYGTALRALRPLANQGDISAQVILGNLYEKGLGIKQDNSTALSWYEKAAEQNSKEGQYNAGLMYFNGSGVEVNREASYQWFSKAAEAGSMEAAYMLGVSYHDGKGVSVNFERARFWFLKSAKQQYANAQLMYAFMLQAGEGGESEPSKAMVWAKIAEKNGQVDALKVIIPASMTLSELEIATAEKIASECVTNSYVSCPS